MHSNYWAYSSTSSSAFRDVHSVAHYSTKTSNQIQLYLLKTHHIQTQQVVKTVDKQDQQGSKSTYSDPKTAS